MLKEFLKSFGEYEKISFVFAGTNDNFGIENGTFISDARSAAFYAMGKVIKTGAKYALVIDGDFLPNIYTCLVEAWFQKSPLTVIALFDNIDEIKTSWADRCTVGTFTCKEEDILKNKNKIYNLSNAKGSVLINILTKETAEPKNDYSEILNLINGALNKKVAVTCYNAKENEEYPNLELLSIAPKHRYGTVSKYIGSGAVADPGILCVTEDCVKLDLNIFRTRYKTAQMKIIITNSGSEQSNNICEWITGNGWECSYKEKADQNLITAFLSEEKPSVLMLK